VYEIDLTKVDPPTIELIGQVELSTLVGLFALQGSRLFMVHWMVEGRRTRGPHWDTVWDFVENKCVSWHLPPKLAKPLERVRRFHHSWEHITPHANQSIFAGDLVIYFNNMGIRVLPVPELTFTAPKRRSVLNPQLHLTLSDIPAQFASLPLAPFNIDHPNLSQDESIGVSMAEGWNMNVVSRSCSTSSSPAG